MSMRVIEISNPGGPDVLVLTDRPRPDAGPGAVLIRVAAAGVNRPDLFQRQGAYPPPPGASDIPGLEVAGVVEAVGDGVSWPAPGDRVTALVAGGGYAAYCAAPAGSCLPVPAGFDFIHAAALPETYFTVWSNLFDRADLKPGETCLIHGGSSGIGTTAIQLAKQFGARVFITAGSAAKCAVCVELGADRAINYRKEDFLAVVKDETKDQDGGAGAHVILDMVAGPYIDRNIKAAAPDGRIVIIAFLQGSKAEADFNGVMRKRLTLTGATLRQRPRSFKAAIASKLREKVWPLLEAGVVKPVIHTTLPLAEAARAHGLMESSRHIGKIMLSVDESLV